MTDVWLDGFEHIQGSKPGGEYLAGVAPCYCGHTTEGLSAFPRASAAAHPWPPQFWYCPLHHPYAPRLRIQLIPINRSGYALAHPAGTPETNRAGAVQCEVEDFAAKTHLWPQASLDAYVDDIIVPICAAAAIDPRNHLTCYGAMDGISPPLASTASPIRFKTAQEQYDYNGLTAHQHWMANDHWDQGKINDLYISQRAASILYPSIPTPTPVPVDPADYPRYALLLLEA